MFYFVRHSLIRVHGKDSWVPHKMSKKAVSYHLSSSHSLYLTVDVLRRLCFSFGDRQCYARQSDDITGTLELLGMRCRLMSLIFRRSNSIIRSMMCSSLERRKRRTPDYRFSSFSQRSLSRDQIECSSKFVSERHCCEGQPFLACDRFNSELAHWSDGNVSTELETCFNLQWCRVQEQEYTQWFQTQIFRRVRDVEF